MSKKSTKIAVAEKELSSSELQKLAHAGTKEAVAKIEKYAKAEKDPEKHAYAEMALEECEFLFYQPTNEKEEEEFLLCELIRRREKHIDSQTMKIDGLELELEKSAIDGKVHEKVLTKHKNKQEEWKYNWMPDFVAREARELEETKESIAYNEAWVAEAKKMITTTRYKNMPARYLERFSFNENSAGNEDCGCGDDCDCDDSYGCGESSIPEIPF